jgi:hypothetical protein
MDENGNGDMKEWSAVDRAPARASSSRTPSRRFVSRSPGGERTTLEPIRQRNDQCLVALDLVFRQLRIRVP